MTLSDAPSLDATHLVCDVHKAEDGLPARCSEWRTAPRPPSRPPGCSRGDRV